MVSASWGEGHNQPNHGVQARKKKPGKTPKEGVQCSP